MLFICYTGEIFKFNLFTLHMIASAYLYTNFSKKSLYLFNLSVQCMPAACSFTYSKSWQVLEHHSLYSGYGTIQVQKLLRQLLETTNWKSQSGVLHPTLHKTHMYLTPGRSKSRSNKYQKDRQSCWSDDTNRKGLYTPGYWCSDYCGQSDVCSILIQRVA